MKKLIALTFALACLFGLTGCSDGVMTLDVGEASKIELRSGNDGTMVEITTPEDIKYITENMNAMTFQKGVSSKDYGGWSYSLEWYDSEHNLMESVVVMSEYQINYRDYFYKGMNADEEIDTSFFDRLLDNEVE